MKRALVYFRFTLGVASALAVGGCGGGSGSMLTPGEVPLTVWAIVGPGESVGGYGNSGCRFTASQIRALVQDLQRSAYIFGRATFTWNGVIQVGTDGNLTGLGPARRTPIGGFFAWYLPEHFEPDTLNVYFAGWIQDPPVNSNDYVYGFTSDPRDVSGTVPALQPYIVINDGGRDLGQGFRYPLAVLLDQRCTLVHEATHFFGRFDSMCFGEGPIQRCYDAGEHVPEGSENILAYCPEGSSRRKIVPFWPDDQFFESEFRQIENRIASGLWDH